MKNDHRWRFFISRWICSKCWIRINCSVLKFRVCWEQPGSMSGFALHTRFMSQVNFWTRGPRKCAAAENNSNTKFKWKFLISNKAHDAQIATTWSTNRRHGVVAESTSEKVNDALTCYTCNTLRLPSESKHTSNIIWWCRRFYRLYLLQSGSLMLRDIRQW